MKVGRRGFLGLMAGGVAAGPKLASSLSQDALLNSPNALGQFAGMGSQLVGGSTGDWKISRIADLKQWLSGEHPDAKHRASMSLAYSLEQRDRFRLDGLRSVAPSHRHSMHMAGAVSRSERIQKLEWERELSELTGGLL